MPDTPFFWYRRTRLGSLISYALLPLTLIWRGGAWLRRLGRTAYSSPLPMITVGNITAGGTGKTPLVALLAEEAQRRGLRPVILTRGHGGSLPGPLVVTGRHSAAEIGDEALMLAGMAPVVISRNRAAGAKLIESRHLGDLILLDDGLQHPSITHQQTVLVFKGSLGTGNEQIIPAGPLREPLHAGLARADAVAITGQDETGLLAQIRKISPDLPLFSLERSLNADDLAALRGCRVVAFAGIGDPDGFFDLLAAANIDLAATRRFADHHPFTTAEIAELRALAQDNNAKLVTTSKDLMRLSAEARKDILAIRLETRADPALMDKLLGPR